MSGDGFDDILSDAVNNDDTTTTTKSESVSSNDAGLPPQQAPAIKLETNEILGAVYSSIFPTMFPSWEVTTDEINLMAMSQGQALDVWFPDGLPWLNSELLNKIIITAGAVAVTAQVVGSRIKKPRKETATVESDQQQEKTTGGGEWEM
jgi:hypothetical protein